MRGRRLVLACALVACVRGPKAPPITSIDVGRATATGPRGEAPAPKGACRIAARDSTLDLKMQAGDELFGLRIIDLPTESELDRDGNAIVRVRSDLAFEGRLVLATHSEASEPSLHVTRDLTLLGGLVKLGTDTEILKPRRAEDSATGLVVVGGYDIEDLPVPCDALRIDQRSTRWSMQLVSNDDLEVDDQRVVSWVTAGSNVLSICSKPSGEPPCIRTKDLRFERLDSTDTSIEIRARFDDGSQIRGWARADLLEKTDEPSLGAYGSSGGCGCGRRMLSHLTIGKPDPREHHGKATLRAGSKIYAVPELKHPWASATNDVVIDIEMRGPDDHARVRDLPGVSTTVGCNCPGMDDHAWVKRESVIPIR